MRASRRRMRPGTAVVILLVFGLLCLFGAVTTWMGVAQAVRAPRIPGTVAHVTCSYASRSEVCSGDFTSTDGSVHEHVTVEGTGGGEGPIPAHLVRAVNTFGVNTIQSSDTVYVGSAGPTIATGVVIGIVLSVLGLPATMLALAVLVLRVLNRAGRRSMPR